MVEATASSVFDKFGSAFAIVRRYPERMIAMVAVVGLFPAWLLQFIMARVEPIEMRSYGSVLVDGVSQPLVEWPVYPAEWMLLMVGISLVADFLALGAYALVVQAVRSGEHPPGVVQAMVASLLE